MKNFVMSLALLFVMGAAGTMVSNSSVASPTPDAAPARQQAVEADPADDVAMRCVEEREDGSCAHVEVEEALVVTAGR